MSARDVGGTKGLDVDAFSRYAPAIQSRDQAGQQVGQAEHIKVVGFERQHAAQQPYVNAAVVVLYLCWSRQGPVRRLRPAEAQVQMKLRVIGCQRFQVRLHHQLGCCCTAQ